MKLAKWLVIFFVILKLRNNSERTIKTVRNNNSLFFKWLAVDISKKKTDSERKTDGFSCMLYAI